mgnify:CR=1 FL=1
MLRQAQHERALEWLIFQSPLSLSLSKAVRDI